MLKETIRLGTYLTIAEFCTCTQTYQKYRDRINPFPQNWGESIGALQQLNQQLLDPIVKYFGRERFVLTYGFCSKDLKKYLNQKDPETGKKNGRVAPHLDQHMAHEKNQHGNYYCPRLGAACDFLIRQRSSGLVVDWIVAEQLN